MSSESMMEALVDRRESCLDVLREAERTGDLHVARQARRLLADADAAVQIAEGDRTTAEQDADVREFCAGSGIDPALLLTEQRATGAELLDRFVRDGDLDAFAEALDTADPAVAEQIREAAA